MVLVVGYLVLFLGAMVIRGIIIQLCWRWFIAAPFALPFLSIPQALGIGLLISYLTLDTGKEDTRPFAEKLLVMFIAPMLLLFCAYVLTFFL